MYNIKKRKRKFSFNDYNFFFHSHECLIFSYYELMNYINHKTFQNLYYITKEKQSNKSKKISHKLNNFICKCLLYKMQNKHYAITYHWTNTCDIRNFIISIQ